MMNSSGLSGQKVITRICLATLMVVELVALGRTDEASAFSPPTTTVTVAGTFHFIVGGTNCFSSPVSSFEYQATSGSTGWSASVEGLRTGAITGGFFPCA